MCRSVTNFPDRRTEFEIRFAALSVKRFGMEEIMSMRIALAGNPNCGKTTLFNALTGSNQFVGNWPGVTVEKKEGKLKKHDGVTITDLPDRKSVV